MPTPSFFVTRDLCNGIVQAFIRRFTALRKLHLSCSGFCTNISSFMARRELPRGKAIFDILLGYESEIFWTK
jgi:hypothetical protein